MAIVAKVYDATNPATLLRTLSADKSRNFRKVLNGAGSGGLVVPLSHADAGYIQSDRIVRFEVDGTVRFGIVVGPHARHVVAEGEEDAQTVEVSGAPGLLSLLGRAVTEHWMGTERRTPDQVRFDFTHVDLDFSGWGNAVQIKQQSASTGQWDDSPRNWPADAASLYWIWPVAQGAGTPPQAVGKGYLLGTGLTLANEGDIAFLWAADDGARIFVDGALLDEQTQAFMWRDTRRANLFLDADYHHIAVEVENIDRPSAAATNVAGFIMAVYSTTNGGDLDTLLYGTDNTWRALTPYPSTAPGMTPGKILDLLLSNASVLGFIPGITWDFTATLDSHGNAWAGTLDVAYDVGANLLDIVANLTELAIDIDLNPATLVLHAYNKGTLGTDRHASVSVTRLTHDEEVQPAIITDALVKGLDGRWHWVNAAPGGVRKGARLDLGTAPSDDAVTRNAQAVLATDGVQRVYATTRVRPVTGATPFVDFDVGDTVTVGADTPVIDAIVVSEPDPSSDGTVGGTTVYDLEPVR